MRCPHCNSRYVRAFASVYNQNLRVGRYLTTNALGLKCAPPRRRRLMPWLAVVILGTLATTAALLVSWHGIDPRSPPVATTLTRLFWDRFPWTLAPVAALLAWVLWAVAAVRYNRAVLPAQYEAWRRQWLCLDCGATVSGPPATE